MDELEIKQKLDLLAEHQSQRDSISLQKQALIDEILTAVIRAKLAKIDAEFSDKISAVILGHEGNGWICRRSSVKKAIRP